MTALGFRPFDADNHYYEATDAFTRHIPKDMERRCMQWVELGGKQRLLVAMHGWSSWTKQGLDGAFFFPTLGVGMEESLRHDLPALCAAFRAFNRWLDDDWGFAYRDRIFGAPYITLADPEWAMQELQWAIGRGVRVSCR